MASLPKTGSYMFGEEMSHTMQPIPPHEKFGYEVVERAMTVGSLERWENDYARMFWQSLEVHNGGLEQWIGNTGKEGVAETLDALTRLPAEAVHRITSEAVEITQLEGWKEDLPFFDYLENNVPNWSERLRPLEEPYWNEAEELDQRLKDLHQKRTG